MRVTHFDHRVWILWDCSDDGPCKYIIDVFASSEDAAEALDDLQSDPRFNGFIFSITCEDVMTRVESFEEIECDS